MRKLPRLTLSAALLSFSAAIAPASAHDPAELGANAEIGFVQIDADISHRRVLVPNPKPKGIVLFLHGFPETLYPWGRRFSP